MSKSLTTRRRLGALLSLELVIALPVMLIVVFAAVEFSLLLLGSQAITAAANVGARHAALPSTTSEDVEEAVFQVLQSWRWAERDHLQVLISVNGELVYDSQSMTETDPDNVLGEAPTGSEILVTLNLKSNQAAPDLLSMVGLGLEDQELTASFVTRKE